MDAITQFMLYVVWIGMLLGVVSGAVIGLFFHREDWMGGYNSYRRRLTRLGHIAFFGLAFVNLGFAVTNHIADLPTTAAWIAAIVFTIAHATMPTICFLTAWRKPLKLFFPIPVLSALTGILITISQI